MIKVCDGFAMCFLKFQSVFSSAILMTVFSHIISHLHKPVLFNLETVQSPSKDLSLMSSQ